MARILPLILAALLATSVLATGSLRLPHAGTVVGKVPNVVAHTAHYMPVGTPHIDTDEAPFIGSTFGIGLPLQYGGDPVEVHNTNYVIFWGPSSAFSSTYKSLVQRYFNDVAGSDLFHTTVQYYQDLGSGQVDIVNDASLGGVWNDTASYTSSDLTTDEFAAEAAKAIAANGWPVGIGYNYFVYTAPGAVSESNGYCAYHSYYNDAGSGALVEFAAMLHPTASDGFCMAPTAPNGDAEADAVASVTSHEHWEAITDPTLGFGWTAADLDEGSDQCNFIFGSTDAAGADTYLSGHPYILQEQWSNAQDLVLGCTMGP